MKKRAPLFHDSDRVHRADTCDPLVAAAAAGEVRLEALVRGTYPGRPMPAGVLPQVSTIGFWDAARDQAWGLGEHRNEGIEITYLDNGRLGFVVDGRSHPLSAGRLTVTRPWQPHSVGDPNVAASRLYWIILDLGVRQPHQAWNWPPWLVLSRPDLRELTSLLRGNENPVWPGTAEIGRCFAELGRLIESSRVRPLQSSRLTLLANEVLVCLLEVLRAQNPRRKASLMLGERSVSMLLARLRDELDAPWTLDRMAEEAGLARTRFGHHCRRLTNLSPMAYLQQQRVEKAKTMLAAGHASVTDIALDCGFGSSAYFSSVFRRHVHCSPSEYQAGRRGKSQGSREAPTR
ncbi:MAG: AraC family transcriptional regulator [Kiritimatiellia bacterium]